MRAASVRSDIAPFHVMDVLKHAAQRQITHGDVISLAAGQPSTAAPAPVLAAARHALENNVLGYTETLGLPALRHTIAEHHRRHYDVDVAPEHVVITTGSSGAFSLLFLAAFDPGDRVVVTRPGYPGYRNCLAALGIEVVELDCGPESRFQLTADMLEALPQRPAGVLIASPANPTGTMIGPAELEAIARWCDANDCLLMSDEIYHGITYVDPSQVCTARQFSRSAVVFGSVSKYYSMTGWRLGWMIVPPNLIRPIERLSSNLTVCPPALPQHAALAAFTPESRAELDGHVARYAANRELLLAELPRLGFGDLAPADGAFYAYASVAALTDDSSRWCDEVLDAVGVAVVPGIDFDNRIGRSTVRFSFAGETASIVEAVARLRSHISASGSKFVDSPG